MGPKTMTPSSYNNSQNKSVSHHEDIQSHLCSSLWADWTRRQWRKGLRKGGKSACGHKRPLRWIAEELSPPRGSTGHRQQETGKTADLAAAGKRLRTGRTPETHIRIPETEGTLSRVTHVNTLSPAAQNLNIAINSWSWKQKHFYVLIFSCKSSEWHLSKFLFMSFTPQTPANHNCILLSFFLNNIFTFVKKSHGNAATSEERCSQISAHHPAGTQCGDGLSLGGRHNIYI